MFVVKNLIGPAFFVVGLIFLITMTGARLALYYNLQDGLEVPIKEVLSLELERGRKGGESVSCLYRYEVDGVYYRSDRVMVFEVSSSANDNFHKDLYDDIKYYRDNPKDYGEPMVCYVNRDNHEEAALYRGFKLTALGFFIIPLGFMGLGGAAIYCSIRDRSWKR